MSGGHWEYENDRLKSELFGYFDKGVFNPRNHNIVGDVKISALIYDVFDLLHDYDWYISGDTCEETWIEKKNAFKKKWLDSKSKINEELIDQYLAVVKEDLMESLVEPKEE